MKYHQSFYDSVKILYDSIANDSMYSEIWIKIKIIAHITAAGGIVAPVELEDGVLAFFKTKFSTEIFAHTRRKSVDPVLFIRHKIFRAKGTRPRIF